MTYKGCNGAKGLAPVRQQIQGGVCMISEMMGETIKASTPSNTGKSTKQKGAAGYGSEYSAKRTDRSQTAEYVKAMDDSARGGHGEKVQPSGGNGSPYTITQQKSQVSAQYRETVAREQQAWLEQKKLEEQTNGKEEEEEKDVPDEVEEMQKQLESLKRMLERMRKQQEEARKKNKNNKPKKKTNYSYRRVSAVISGAKTFTQASQALSTATANLSSVRRMAASSQYDSKDVELALAHAQKMVRTARKKYANIKFEFTQKNRHKSVENHSEKQVAQIHRPARRQKMQRELERLKSILKSQESQQKSKNRRTEDMELMMADMQYIKRKIELLQNDSNQLNSGNVIESIAGGISEEMTSTAAQMENLGMAETAMNAEAGAEAAATAGAEAGAASAAVGE